MGAPSLFLALFFSIHAFPTISELSLPSPFAFFGALFLNSRFPHYLWAVSPQPLRFFWRSFSQFTLSPLSRSCLSPAPSLFLALFFSIRAFPTISELSLPSPFAFFWRSFSQFTLSPLSRSLEQASPRFNLVFGGVEFNSSTFFR